MLIYIYIHVNIYIYIRPFFFEKIPNWAEQKKRVGCGSMDSPDSPAPRVPKSAGGRAFGDDTAWTPRIPRFLSSRGCFPSFGHKR